MRRQGFTLIELLVVIAIIALLVSILAPSLTKIMDTAKHTQCKTNLSALRKTMLGYSSENNGEYPSESLSSETSQAGVLSHFAYDQGVKGAMFLCPATTDDEEIIPTFNPTPVPGSNEGSYSYQDCGDTDRKITDESKGDVVFIADKKNETTDTTNVSKNHNSGEFMFYASKGGVYSSPKDVDVSTLDPAIFGRAANNIYSSDPADNSIDFTLRDDSNLLEIGG